MTIRSIHISLLLVMWWCLTAGAQNRQVIPVQIGGSESASPARPGAAIPIPSQRCPTLEELGYQFRRLSDVSLDIRLLEPELPADCATHLFRTERPASAPSYRPIVEFSWVASELYHQPLYFEDAILERSGQAFRPAVQPWLSGAHFFCMFPIMPYLIGIDHPYDRVYTLGYYRPGTPTPCLGRRLPLEADAAALEAATWVGLFFLLP